MTKEYFIFYHNENASWGLIGLLTKEECLDRITENYYGKLEFVKNVEDINENYTGLAIIKGSVIMPKAVEVVKKYSFDSN
jgi:hypothetical protein